MEYGIPASRPAKRARIQDSSPQWDISAWDHQGVLPSIYQAESAQATVPAAQYPGHPLLPIALPDGRTPVIHSLNHSVSAETRSQWPPPIIQHSSWDRQRIENISRIQDDAERNPYFPPSQSLLKTESSTLPVDTPWQLPTSFNEYGPIPAKYFFSSELHPAQSAVANEGYNHHQLPVTSDSVCDFKSNVDCEAYYNSSLDPGAQLTVPTLENETVCFGMIQHLSGICDAKVLTEQIEFEVQFDSSVYFSSTNGGINNETISGQLHSVHSQMIHGLLHEDTLQLFVTCIISKDSSASKSARCLKITPCSIEITIYGPLELLEEIGDWFQEQDIYLQDPRLCHLNVRYCNPQRLSSCEVRLCPLVSDVTTKKTLSVQMKAISSHPNFLDALNSRDDLYEAQQPTAIRSVMKRHQKQALTFMKQRENGWSFNQEFIDIWEMLKTEQGPVFVNKITEAYQIEEPAQFRGGIIADTMGLGKTLSMIALVASDLDARRDFDAQADDHFQSAIEVNSTLVIIPPPLLDTWDEQLAEHVFNNRLTWCRHHGKNKITSIEELNSQHMVLTTYHTVSAEWKAYKNAQSSVLFSVRWRRLILDEAHFIRNSNSMMARAVYALLAHSRWAVSGTPVQNRLADLTSLLRFIQAVPYDDPKQFESDISSLWKSGEDEVAVKRLQHLSACLLLRRAKGTIELPPRKDLLFPVDFLHDERLSYEVLRQQALSSIDEAVSGHPSISKPNVYANALQRIESLRLFSDLGLHYNARQESRKDHEWSSIAQQTFNSRHEVEPTVCMQCLSFLDVTESLLDVPNSAIPNPQFSRCMKFVCSDCVRKLNRDKKPAECGHRPACPMAPISTTGEAFEEIPITFHKTSSPSLRLPSKVEALITDLQRLPKDIKCVVFSTWRLTLDLVKVGLDQSSIESIRFDGKVPQNERGAVVERFRTDPEVRVMLLTLSCGAVGLTLTAASRAYLMEPHWNPTLEEQALARIYRLGQTKEVTTVRLYMRDSFEEEVIKVQESKKKLADVLLLPHDGARAGDNRAILQGLRSLL
ncbi:SNF2 family N-terminal domain-containing protein [Xylariaceae sp. FL1651]|nr:SNF2 family N-terminal domain-containing protein [Xylariaceae sp. FL1651]